MRIQLDANELLEVINDNESTCMSLTPRQKVRLINLVTGCGVRKANDIVRSLGCFQPVASVGEDGVRKTRPNDLTRQIIVAREVDHQLKR